MPIGDGIKRAWIDGKPLHVKHRQELHLSMASL
jgi:hypothetical protein